MFELVECLCAAANFSEDEQKLAEGCTGGRGGMEGERVFAQFRSVGDNCVVVIQRLQSDV